MNLIQLKISTKNKQVLTNFLKFLKKVINTKKLKYKTFFRLNLKTSNCNHQNNQITILTSPHINKNAQEHFILKKYSKKINIFSFKSFKFLIIIKKMNLILYPEINIQIRLFKTKIVQKKTFLKTINPEMYKVNNIEKNTNQKSLKFRQNILKRFKITKNTLKKFKITKNIPKKFKITKNILKKFKITKNILKKFKITKNILKKFKITKNIPKKFKITKNIPKKFKITKNIPKKFKITKNIPKKFKITKNIPKKFKITKNILKKLNKKKINFIKTLR